MSASVTPVWQPDKYMARCFDCKWVGQEWTKKESADEDAREHDYKHHRVSPVHQSTEGETNGND